MVKFKQVKYKHQHQAAEIAKAIANKTATEEQIIEFVIGMVESWDYIDGDTGQVIPLGDWQELTIDQFNDLMGKFNATMEELKVKKTINAPASSGRNGFNQVRRAKASPKVHQTG